MAKLWWQRLASSEIPCFVLSPPTTYTLHLFTLFLHLSSFSPQLYRTMASALPFLYKSLLLESHSSLLQLPTSSDCGSRATPFYLTTNTQLLSANILQHTDFFFSFTKDIQEFSVATNTQLLSAYILQHTDFFLNFTKDFEESYMTSNTHIRPYSTLSFSKEISFPRLSSFGLMFCTS